MRKSMYLLLGTLLCLLTACSSEFNVFQTEGVQWTRFQWVAAEIGGQLEEKAAIMLPLKLDGQDEGNLLMQLDTGCWNTLFYEIPFQLIDKDAYSVKRTKNDRPLVVQYDGTIGTLPIKRGLAVIKQDYGTPYEKLQGDIRLGTIGLDLAYQRVLVLDFRNQRLCFVNDVAELPSGIAERVSYLPATLQQNMFTVVVTVGDRELRLLYDTGSSMFPIMLESSLWREIVDQAGEGPEVRRFPINSWDRMVEVVGAPLPGVLSLGEISADEIYAYRVSAMDQLFAQAGVDGLIGNALFYDDYVVILDLKEMRFGFAKLE